MQESIKHSPLSSLAQLSKHTFGNFSLREGESLSKDEQQSLSKAFKAAQQFAEHPSGWLVLLGDTFTGKTHLAAAIGNFAHTSFERAPLFVGVPDLLDHLRATFNPNSPRSYDRLFEEVRSSPLLILDDLGTQNATSWAREKLYQVFNYRYNAELPTVITSVLTLDDLEEQDPRIFSRMRDVRLCRIHKLLVPPYTPAAETPKGRRKRRE
jgi:DNA replication protein DnaC